MWGKDAGDFNSGVGEEHNGTQRGKGQVSHQDQGWSISSPFLNPTLEQKCSLSLPFIIALSPQHFPLMTFSLWFFYSFIPFDKENLRSTFALNDAEERKVYFKN
jgi:hypothetical protein